MGSSIERWVQEHAGQLPQGANAKSSDIDQWLAGQETQAKLGIGATTSATTDPATAARVLRLQSKTGLPEDLIARNLDSIEADARKADFDPAKYMQANPVVARWLAEHPQHVALASQDLTKLSYLERQVGNIKAQFTEGRHLGELQDIGEAAILGTITPAQRKRQAELDAQARDPQRDYGITGFFEGIPGAIANQLPIFANTFFGKVKAAIFGGAVGAGVQGTAAAGTALVAGQLGPQAATPEEVVTVPGAFLAGAAKGGAKGAGIGWKYGGAVAAGRMEAALAYLEFEKIRDERGLPLDRATMVGAAGITGILNGALEMVGFESVAKSIPGLRLLGREGLRDMLMRQTTRQAIQGIAKNVGEAMLTEGATEFMQDVVKNSAGELSTMISDGSIKTMSVSDILGRIFSDEHVQEAIQDARAGAQGGGGMAAAGGAASMVTHFNNIKVANQRQQFFQAIGGELQDSEMLKAMPEKTQEVIERLTKDGPVENVYIPVEEWNTYWQAHQVDPAAAAEEVTGSRTSYDEAQQTGGDITIKTARWAVTIAPSEHNKFFSEVMRLAPDEMNAKEAKALSEELDKLDKEQTTAAKPGEESASAVQQAVAEQLRATGRFTEPQIAAQSQLHGDIFRTLGQRLGKDPTELFKRYGLQINAQDMPENVQTEGLQQAALPGEWTAMGTQLGTIEQSLMDKAAAGDDSKQISSQLYAVQTLMDAVKNKDIRRARELYKNMTDFPDSVGKEFLQRLERTAPAMIEALHRPVDIMPGFRSKLETLIGEKAQNKMTVEQAKAVVSGAKAEEQTWTGITSWLDAMDPNTPVTKEQLLDYARQHRVELVRESLVGNPDEQRSEVQALADAYAEDQASERVTEIMRERGLDPWGDERDRYFERFINSDEYQGILDNALEQVIEEEGMPVEEGHGQYENYTLPGAEDGSQVEEAVVMPGNKFTSSHWGNRAGIVAHIRRNMRKVFGTGAKIMHIEELQSDLHQKGREHGYANSPEMIEKKANLSAATTAARDALQAHIDKHQADFTGTSADEGQPWYQEFLRLNQAVVTAEQAERTHDWSVGELPDKTPLAKTWHEMTFRAVVAEAVKSGAKYVTWTTGQQQVDRYDHSGFANLTDKQRAGLRGFYDDVLVRYAMKFAKTYGSKVEHVTIDLVGDDQSIGELERMTKKVGLSDAEQSEYDALDQAVEETRIRWQKANDRLYDIQQEVNSILDSVGLEAGAAQLADLDEERRNVTRIDKELAFGSKQFIAEIGGQENYDRWRALNAKKNERVPIYPITESADGQPVALTRVHSMEITPAMERAARHNEFELYQRAYHGTPHQFDRFNLTKIGSGEGAQAFGWGLYFAGAKDLAQHYRDTLLKRLGPMVDGLSQEENLAIPYDVRRHAQMYPGPWMRTGLEDRMSLLEDRIMANERLLARPQWMGAAGNEARKLNAQMQAEWNALNVWGRQLHEAEAAGLDPKEALKFTEPKGGRIFTVEIPEMHEMLHWDKSFAEQDPKVRSAVLEMMGVNAADVAVAEEELGESMTGNLMYEDLVDSLTMLGKNTIIHIPAAVLDATFPDIPANVVDKTTWMIRHAAERAPQLASRWMNYMGIKGIAYLKGVSRGSGSDRVEDHNFVVFDDQAINIINHEQSQQRGPMQEGVPNDSDPIIAAASRVAKTGEVFTGTWHGESDEKANAAGNQAENTPYHEHGFVTKSGKFLTRRQALAWIGEYDESNPNEELNSEDIGLSDTDRQFEQGPGAFDVRKALGLPQKPKEEAMGPQLPPRGRIRIGEHSMQIDLFKTADLSTFLHESGHFYLEVLDDLGSEHPELAGDRSVVRQWLGLSENEPLTREAHETFARGFEAYLMDGKAPTSALRQAFAKFRAWLTGIYKTVKNLNVGVSPEIARVFDRLIATDDELAAATQESSAEPMFADPEAVGMTPGQAAVYASAVEDARQAAETSLTSKMMREITREQTAQYKAARDKMRTSVVEEVNSDPRWRAVALLTRGTLPDGSPLPENIEAFKLSKTALVANYGREILQRLPRPHVYEVAQGLHPDIAADILGFKSGEELVNALVSTSESPKAYIERLTDQRTRDQEGELQSNGQLHEEAIKSVHNDKRALLLQKELQHLASTNLAALKGLVRKVARPLAPIEEVRKMAESTIQQKIVRDIRPIVYQRAEAKAGRLALEALLKGDIQQAFEQKQKQLLNAELYRAASNAQDQVGTIVEYMSKFNRESIRNRLGKAGGSYLAQIDAIRSRFDFTRNVTTKELTNREALREFVDEQHKLGFTISIPEKVLNEAYRQHYKEISLDELAGIHETVQQIDHLARVKNRLLASARARSLAGAVADITSSIGATHKIVETPPDFAPSFMARLKTQARGMIAAHTKMEFMFEWLDGNKEQGPAWMHLFKPMVDAENAESIMMRNSVKAIRDIFSVYPTSERATWFWHKITIDGIQSPMTKANILAVALNQGNEYNKDALMRGYGWTQQQVDSILAKMDGRDWAVVQKIWDHLESYWPAIAKLEKDLNGLPPEKVEASEVQTPYGKLRGGYYPIVFDSKLSWRQAVAESRNAVPELFGGQWARAMTRHGHTEARNNTGGKPILLELSGLSEHIANVAHDLSHRRAVIDVNRITQSPEVRNAIESSIGKEMYRQLHPWLMNVAGARRGDYVNPIEGLLGRARMGATVANMGWKVTTGLAQFLSYTNTIKEVGAKYSMTGLNQVYGKPWKFKQSWDFVTSRSEFMKDRIESYDRDVHDALKRINIAGGKPGPLSILNAYATPVRDSFFMFVGLMDMGASLPTWMGAYSKAMDGGIAELAKGDEQAAIDYADKVVRQTQGVGAAKDLANVQTGSEVYKLFTMFYSYFNVLFNQFAKTTHEVRLTKNIPRFVASMALLWFMPAALQELIVGRGPSADDGEDEWAKWIAAQEVSYPFQTIVLLRDVINGMGRFGYEPSAAFDAFKQTSQTGKAILGSVIDDQEFTRADAKSAAATVGYFFKLPTKQLWLTGEYFHDWLTGDEQPESPAEALWRSAVTGKKRETP